MIKTTNNKGKRANFKKIVGAIALCTFLFPSQAYASRSPKNLNKKAPFSIILGARGGHGFYGGEFGIRYKNLALVGNLGSGSDLNLQDTEENVFGDVYFQGREDLKDFSSIGASLEYHPRLGKGISWVIGAGGGLEKVTREIEENLVRDGTVLASNKTSTPEKEFAGYFYTGPKIKITKGLSLNPNIGYKTGLKKGIFANIRADLSFSRRGNR